MGAGFHSTPLQQSPLFSIFASERSEPETLSLRNNPFEYLQSYDLLSSCAYIGHNRNYVAVHRYNFLLPLTHSVRINRFSSSGTFSRPRIVEEPRLLLNMVHETRYTSRICGYPTKHIRIRDRMKHSKTVPLDCCFANAICIEADCFVKASWRCFFSLLWNGIVLDSPYGAGI